MLFQFFCRLARMKSPSVRGGKILLAVSTTRRNYNVAWCVAQRVALELRNADKGTVASLQSAKVFEHCSSQE